MTGADGPIPESRDPSSALRHDLINPVNQILGYTELLLVDHADGLSWPSRADRLRAIRELGRRARETIDDALIREPHPHPDLRALALEVVGISRAIVEVCEGLEGDAAGLPERDGFLDDLGRIREATDQLSEMIRQASSTAPDGRVS